MPFLSSHFCCADVTLKPALLLAVLVQLVMKLGMSNLNESLGPLADGLAVQVSDAIFGDHVVHIAAGGEHARAMRQARHNARHSLVPGRRGQRDDRLAPLGARRSTNEIELTAKAAVKLRPD